MAFTQQNRKIRITTPLGADVLLFYRMHGVEKLNEAFEYSLELLSANLDIDPDSILGKTVTVRLEMDNGAYRYFNGHVTRFGQFGAVNKLGSYRATVRPWLWFLTRASNCRIFQQQTAPDIVKKVFRDQGFTNFKDKLTRGYTPREYCVQYRETDFNFINRLLEEEGICYYFSHGDGEHELILVDEMSAHDKFPGYANIPYHDDASPTDRSRGDHIHDWGYAHEVQPGVYQLTDYDFTKPKSKLLVKSKIGEANAYADFEYFDYPGRYTDTGAGETLARNRIEELHDHFQAAEGQGNARGLAVGYLFSLEQFPVAGQNKQYLITSADFRMQLDDYLSGGGGGEAKLFDCSFTALDSAKPFRPPRATRKPLVSGAQTAVVVGPGGDEIYTDKYGRIKVQFHWDRYGGNDQNSSCWMRVAQPWAGKNWGMVAIPRIGQEVVVDFLEGDPDQPLVVGSVYNADMPPPYDLPANATQTGIKSRSSKGGGAANFNELRFEDKMGSEEMYIHAEKDQNIVVENDRTELIGRDRKLTVDRDKLETVERNKVINVVGNHSENIDGAMSIVIGKTLTESVLINYAETVGGAMELTVGAALAITVGAVMSEAVAGTKSEAIGGSKTESIANNKTLNIGKDLTQAVGGNRSVTVSKDVSETISGKQHVEVAKEAMLQAKKVQITAEDEISLKTGDAEIIMKKNGDITINGGKITIKASGDMILKGSKISEN